METPDRDTAEVIAILRDALAQSGLSQGAFARAVGTSASRFSTYLGGSTHPSAQLVVRARRLGRSLGAAADRGLMSAPATGVAMREALRSGEIQWVWRMLLQGRDHLVLMLGERDRTLIDAWEAEPTSVGSAEWDALLAALVSHEFAEAEHEAPVWARGRTLAEPWIPTHPFLDEDRVRAQTPEWLSARNIFVPARDLVTA